jgi:hypothetical protein
MYTVRKFNTALDLAKFLRGTLISDGTLTSALSGATIADTAGTLETDEVAADDVIYISGGGEEVVASIGSEGALTMDGSLTADDGAAYRVCRGKISSSDIINIAYEENSAMWVLIYEADPAF